MNWSAIVPSRAPALPQKREHRRIHAGSPATVQIPRVVMRAGPSCILESIFSFYQKAENINAACESKWPVRVRPTRRDRFTFERPVKLRTVLLKEALVGKTARF